MIDTSLERLLEQIDRLSSDKLSLVKQHVDARYRVMLAEETPEEKIAALDAALEHFWDGLTPTEINEVVAVMNEKNIVPDDDHLFDWVDNLPEDQR